MDPRLEWGARVEERALEYLVASGRFRLLARNFRCRAGEVDLILEETRERGRVELVFVEVRARSAGGWVSAEESVTWPKRQRLRRAISIFLASYRGPARAVRIDVLGWDGKAWTHLSDVHL